jgi:hypothetical protein
MKRETVVVGIFIFLGGMVFGSQIGIAVYYFSINCGQIHQNTPSTTGQTWGNG